MNRRLIVSSIAKLDLVSIFDAIADHNVTAAARLLAKIESSCLMLVAQPFVGPAFSERYPGLRFRVVGKYVVFYRVFDDSVWIQRVLHSARDATRLL
jgi:toxin ParE1/3/4